MTNKTLQTIPFKYKFNLHCALPAPLQKWPKWSLQCINPDPEVNMVQERAGEKICLLSCSSYIQCPRTPLKRARKECCKSYLQNIQGPRTPLKRARKECCKSYLQNLVQGVSLGRFYKLALKTKVFTLSERLAVT